MSVYFCGTQVDGRNAESVKRAIEGFVDDDYVRTQESISLGAYAICYSTDKAIEDVLVILRDEGSWVLFVGSPIVSANGHDRWQDKAKSYLANPKRFLANEIDGHYAVIGFDSVNRKYYCGSDWNSLIPVYYTVEDGGPAFSNSELLLAKLSSVSPDDFGFSQAIQQGVVWGNRTRFNEVKKLQACELLTVDENGENLKVHKYWEPGREKMWGGSFQDITDQWIDVMRRTIRMFSEGGNAAKLSADITGGEDSRLVVALLHDLGRPFNVRVAGEIGDVDVKVARNIERIVGLGLQVEETTAVNEEDLARFSDKTFKLTDSYGSFFTNIATVCHEKRFRPMEYKNVHLCGLPGGEQFRGAYYARAKLVNSCSFRKVDSDAFLDRKFLLDYVDGLLDIPDGVYKGKVRDLMNKAIEEVKMYPSGIRIDHVLRVFQTCLVTAAIKRPFYFAFSSRDMTRSTYNVPPNMKRGGKQTKAITEILYPEIAWVKTQTGVPTVRKTLTRQVLFIPEVYALAKKAIKGVTRQLIKVKPLRSGGTGNARHHEQEFHEKAIKWLFETEPYASWLSSAASMSSSAHYNTDALNKLLASAKKPGFKHVQLLGRIINQEIAYRIVYEHH